MGAFWFKPPQTPLLVVFFENSTVLRWIKKATVRIYFRRNESVCGSPAHWIHKEPDVFKPPPTHTHGEVGALGWYREEHGRHMEF